MAEDYVGKGNKRILIAGAVALAIVALIVGSLIYVGTRSGRPVPAPQTVSFGSGEKEDAKNAGESITLQVQQVKNAGIVAEAAGEGIADASGSVQGTGIVQTDAYKDVKVTSPIGGRIKSFSMEPGAKIAKGGVIALVESEDFIRAQGEYLAARTAAENARNAHQRALRLLEINQPGRSDYEMAVRAAAAASAALSEAKSRFERAEKMLALGSMSREQYESEQAKLKTAEAEAAEAAARLDRAGKLLEVRPEAKAQAEAAFSELTKAESDLAATRERLRLIGMTDAEIAALRNTADVRREMRLRSPVSGTLISRNVVSGEFFDKDRELFRVADLTELWFLAQVSESELSKVKVGSIAEIGIGFSPGDVRGRIAYVDPTLNEKSRTAQVRVVFRNSGDSVRLGSYATLRTVGGSGGGRRAALVKSSAIQRIGDADFVFVSKSDGVTFELRQVRTGVESGGLVPLLEGVAPGESVVVEGAFLIRAEFLKRKAM